MFLKSLRWNSIMSKIGKTAKRFLQRFQDSEACPWSRLAWLWWYSENVKKITSSVRILERLEMASLEQYRLKNEVLTFLDMFLFSRFHYSGLFLLYVIDFFSLLWLWNLNRNTIDSAFRFFVFCCLMVHSFRIMPISEIPVSNHKPKMWLLIWNTPTTLWILQSQNGRHNLPHFDLHRSSWGVYS